MTQPMRPNLPELSTAQTVVDPVKEPIEREEEDLRLEPPYRVLIHNDDVTPYDYVVRLLQHIFLLSEEMADHIAWTAHHEGLAVVVVRPRPEAEKLTKVARARAQLDGYPLTFTMEADD
jgi:ATP-dependent Clp protease adaptor protein ClpS